MDETTAQPPVCGRCGDELEEWVGNVMVPREQLQHKHVGSVEVWCKRCTREADDSGEGREYHNLWELSWVRDYPLYLAWGIINDLSSERQTWTSKALDAILALTHLAHRDQMLNPLEAALEKAERESSPGYPTQS